MFISLIAKGIIVLAIFSAAIVIMLCMASSKCKEEIRNHEDETRYAKKGG